MNNDELIQSLGIAERSAASKKLLSRLKIRKSEILLTQKEYLNPKLGISLVYRDRSNFEHYYGPVKGSVAGSKYFLEEINFGEEIGSKKYPYPMPFDLKLGDTTKVIQEKLDGKPAESSKTGYGSYSVFYPDGVQLLVRFDKKGKLMEFKVRPIETAIRKKLKIKNSDSFIPVNKNELLKLKDQSPVNRWEKRMEKGDTRFNKRNLGSITALLSDLIDQLATASERRQKTDIVKLIGTVVKKVNKLNKKSFIETLEREELVGFLHKIVRTAGYKMMKGVDLTEADREW